MADPLVLEAARPEDLPELLAFVDARCADAGLSESAAFAVRLAAEEAFMNVLNHGYRGEAGPVRLSFDRDDDRVTLTLADQAPAFDPRDAPAPDLESDVESRTEGGLGLHLIRELMDEVHHTAQPDGNVLTLIKHVGDSDEH